MGLFNADVEIPDDFQLPESWKVPGSENVTMSDYPRYKSVRRDVTNDPWGFCHQIMKNIIAKNPAPQGSFQTQIPSFTDFSAGNNLVNANPSWVKKCEWHYRQWINCLIDYEDETHPTCMKARWYAERFTPNKWLAKWDDAREAGDEYAVLIRQKRRPSNAMYQPFKVLNPGAYEWNWLLGRAWTSPEDLGRMLSWTEVSEKLSEARLP